MLKLKNIQDITLEMVVNPSLIDLLQNNENEFKVLYSLDDEDLLAVKSMDLTAVKSFSNTIALKRIVTSNANTFIKKTISALKITGDFEKVVNGFISENVMHRNEWSTKILDFLDYVDENIEDNVVNKISKYERWTYELSLKKEDGYTHKEKEYDYAISKSVGLYRLPFSSDLILNDKFTIDAFEEIKSSPDENNYLLGIYNEDEFNIFEIDNVCYELLSSLDEPTNEKVIFKKIESLSYKHNSSIDPNELFRDLLSLEIIK